MNNFYLGADPEVFVGDAISVRSVIGKVGGTKAFPRPLLELGDGFAVQEDNVALEYNIPASPTKELFVSNIASANAFLQELMQGMHGLSFYKQSAISFPETELDHPNALAFGCDPDFNAWTGRRNPRPHTDDWKLRSCGGHIHIGIADTKYADLNIRSIMQFMDLRLGVPSILMDQGELRKQLYGKAGAYRPKKYGGEYRSLSNYWIFDRRLTEWVHEETEQVLECVLTGFTLEDDAVNIQTAINTNDKKMAESLVKKYNLVVL